MLLGDLRGGRVNDLNEISELGGAASVSDGGGQHNLHTNTHDTLSHHNVTSSVVIVVNSGLTGL